MSAGADGPVGEPVDSPPWSVSTKAIVVSVALILLGIVIWRFQFLITPLVVAGVLAYLLNPLITWVERKTPMKRIYAVLLVYGGLLLIGGGGAVALGVAAASQVSKLVSALPQLIPDMVNTVEASIERWSDAVIAFGPYQFWVGNLWADADLNMITNQLRVSLQQFAGGSGSMIAGLARGTVSTFATGLLIYFISIYIAHDVPKIGRSISNLAQQPGYRQDAERLVQQTLVIWNAYLRGQVVLALVIGVAVSLSLSILGVNDFLALGLLSGVLEFLPTVGPIVGAAAAVGVAMLQPGNYLGLSPWVYGLVVLGVMIAIQQIENNILVPRIVGEALDLHPIAVIVGVLMGASLAGLLGAVLAAPVLATLKLIGAYVWRKVLDLPPFSPDSDAGEADDSADSPGLFARVRCWVGGKERASGE